MTRKELKESYKNKKFRIGVFQIRNLNTGKIFIEGSFNLDAIWNRHRAELAFGTHQNAQLQKDWKLYGEENFVYEVLSELQPSDSPFFDEKKEIKILEQLFIEDLQPYNERGYHKEKN